MLNPFRTFPHTEDRGPEYKYRVNNNSRSASKRRALVLNTT